MSSLSTVSIRRVKLTGNGGIVMKQLFGLLVMGLVVGFVGCATNVEKGDELPQQGKY